MLKNISMVQLMQQDIYTACKTARHKESKMYESQIVEVEDFNFCHYINHFEDYEKDIHLTYEEMFESNDTTIAYEEYEEFTEF
ncbi:hypothetical protein FJR48_04000 [Sulfurimonas lithotrophica]|uniref:Uncharacterized protein n=1 Tax=Sulfurimonas lithotrophica TaxID=2590022 RepID=A0A5P8NZP5_9BACT|nr:hypothetical protein [Sulfurimonas lithotrophica]QFR48926.1 hypothetical protein FJR48_04000 [Sulfurimonas lithotrophica]